MKLPAQCRRWLNQIQPELNDAPCARRIVVAYPYTHGRNRAPSSSMGYTSTRLPVPYNFTVNTALSRKDSHTVPVAPLTKPRCLSKLRVKRTLIPGRASIRRGDFDAGSHRYPVDSSSSSIPATRRAALQISAAPAFVLVSHVNTCPVVCSRAFPRRTASSSDTPRHCRSAKYSASTYFH